MAVAATLKMGTAAQGGLYHHTSATKHNQAIKSTIPYSNPFPVSIPVSAHVKVPDYVRCRDGSRPQMHDLGGPSQGISYAELSC